MSETVTEPVEPVVTETPEPAPAPQPVEATPEAETEPTPEPGAAPTEPEQPKPRRADRHVANLTARLAAERDALAAAERRAEAAEALLRAGREGDLPNPTPAMDVEARATQIAAEREFNRKLAEIDTSGKKELGSEAWEEAKSVLTGLGATANQAFLQALAETENPAKIFAALADDTDQLVGMLAKSPQAMAVQLARLDVKMEAAPPKPVLSNAPKPPVPIRAAAVEAEPDWHDPRMSIQEWNKIADKMLPRHLGGRRA